MKTALLAALAALVLLSCATTQTGTEGESAKTHESAGTGATLSVPCAKMGGEVRFSVELEGANLVVIVSYPRSIGEYLGGFSEGGKNYSASIAVHLDTDSNPATGLKADPGFEPGAGGSEYSIGATEVTTSLARDAQGNWISGPMLMVDVSKGRESWERPDDVVLRWEMERNGRFYTTDWVKPPDARTMRLRIPAAALGLKAGSKIRVTGVVPLCNDAYPFAGFREATFVLSDRPAASALAEDDEESNRQGVDFANRGEYDMAIAAFTKAVGINPGNAKAYFNRGYVYQQKGDRSQAISDYTAAIAADPRDQDAYGARGYLYAMTEENDKAIADYTQALEISPGDLRVLLDRGSLYYCLGSFTEAAQDYRKMIEIDGSNEFIRLLLLTALAKTSKGEYKKSLSDLRAFVKANASEEWIRTVSKYYLGMDGVNEARLLKSAKTGDDEALTKDHLCNANYFIAEKRLTEGNRKGARESFRKSAESGLEHYVCCKHGKAMLKLTRDRKL